MEERRRTREWVERWARTAKVLAAIRRHELPNRQPGSQCQLVDALLEIACSQGRQRTHSGMVEMQRLFRKLRV